ncbi:hypothetical protein [Oryzomonas rubra]|uniref:PDZ domain-containing protein n=1 Tax=Oryzomonas rubra TaxID=2509454 RepID=A0A5A9XF61_9BACT|nr:hypothetical protein [Oryzomonas rubra]KAA0891646.1 hypothetical protein ET418_09360 [Oryzomonas rubra]
MKYLTAYLVSVFVISVNPLIAHSIDFYGIEVVDSDTPSSFMKYGVYGYHPTVKSGFYEADTTNLGFRRGDIIISINNKNIRSSSELYQFKTDILTVLVFSKNEKKTLTIDRAALEKDKSVKIEKQIIDNVKYIANDTYSDEKVDNRPTLKFDDKYLERKFGKSTPEQKAMENQRANAANERFKKEAEVKAADEYKQKLIREQLVENQKLAKINCTGIPGECGEGRVCLMTLFDAKCMQKEEAERKKVEIRQQLRQSENDFNNARINHKLNDIKNKLDYGY